MEFRYLTYTDLKFVQEIYGLAVAKGLQTGHLSIPEASYWKHWYESHSNKDCPVWVAMIDNKVVAWLSLSYYRNGREAFLSTREISYYVHPDYFKRGAATGLLQKAERYAAQSGITTLLAIVIASNLPSLQLLKKCGYSQWGILPEVVVSGDKVYDHLYFGKKII